MHPDCISNHWLLVWVAEQLADGNGILHNQTYYWPVGDAPVLAGNGAEGVAYLPFHLLLGWPSAAVVYLTCLLVFNGMGAWILGRALGAGPLQALLPAAATTVNPYLLSEMSAGRFSQVSIGWMLLTLAAWLNLLEAPSRHRAILAGLLWAITGFFYWYHAWFVALALALVLAARALARRPMALVHLLVGAATAAVLIAPWAWLFAASWSRIPGTSEAFPPMQAQLDSIWPRVPFLGDAGEGLGTTSALVWLAGLAGAIHSVVRGSYLHRWALAVWLFFTLLAMGPFAPWAPYTLLYDLAPPLRRFWWPMRHTVLAGVLWAALGAVWLSQVRLGRAVAVVVALTTPVLIGLQGAQHQVRTTSLDLIPPGVQALLDLPDGVILQPPIAPEASGSQLPMLLQILHKKRMLGGHAQWVERVRPEAWDAGVAGNSYLASLQALERGEVGETLHFEAADLEALRESGLRWFVLDRATFPFGLQSAVRAHKAAADSLFGQPVIRGRGLRVWDMEQWTGAHSVSVPPVDWPADLIPAGPTRPLTARRPHPPIIVLEP
jgi:hypothetical protein